MDDMSYADMVAAYLATPEQQAAWQAYCASLPGADQPLPELVEVVED